MKRPAIFFLLALALSLPIAAQAADISGKWTAEFDTRIGVQKYTYEFKVDDGKLTGKAISANGSTDIQEGKVSGDDVSFVEMLEFQDMKIRVEYKGKVAGNEIKFTRQVGEFATEQLVARRAT
jgi:translation initiation factor IF-1